MGLAWLDSRKEEKEAEKSLYLPCVYYVQLALSKHYPLIQRINWGRKQPPFLVSKPERPRRPLSHPRGPNRDSSMEKISEGRDRGKVFSNKETEQWFFREKGGGEETLSLIQLGAKKRGPETEKKRKTSTLPGTNVPGQRLLPKSRKQGQIRDEGGREGKGQT